MSKVHPISKLSDYACTIVRQRNARACLVIVIEDGGGTSQGIYCEKSGYHEIQDALCEAIIENANYASRVDESKKEV